MQTGIPSGFVWDSLNVRDPYVLECLYEFLKENYVEDKNANFRIAYSKETLLWILCSPGSTSDCCIGVRMGQKLVGFVSGCPGKIRVSGEEYDMGKVNFLCVDKKFRSKRLCLALIDELKQRSRARGLVRGVYTSGFALPNPIATCKYWNRPLNPQKLMAVNFLELCRNVTVKRAVKLYTIPNAPSVKGFRRAIAADLDACFVLYNECTSKFDVAAVFSLREFHHWFSPENVVMYVVENDAEITDFTSFYVLPLTVIGHPLYESVQMAYSFYNVSTATPLPFLIQDTLVAAKNMGMDVYTALDVMDNAQFLNCCKFREATGNLYYFTHTLSPLASGHAKSYESHTVGLIVP